MAKNKREIRSINMVVEYMSMPFDAERNDKTFAMQGRIGWSMTCIYKGIVYYKRVVQVETRVIQKRKI